MFCAIWHHLYNLQNVKNTHGGVLILVRSQTEATLLKVTLLHRCFPDFLDCKSATKLRNASCVCSWRTYKFKKWVNAVFLFFLVKWMARNIVM